MRNLRLSISFFAVILLLSSAATAANARPPQIIEDAVQIVELADALGRVLNAAEEGAISLFNYAQVREHYSETLSGQNVGVGTGVLLDATILEATASGRKFVLAPLIVGAGTSAEQVGLRATLGQRTIKHETLAADLSWLSDYNEISSLPKGFSVSDSSRLYWLYRRNDGKFTIYLIEDSKTFWAAARHERTRLLIQSSVIQSLPKIEAIRARSESYSDIASIYRGRIAQSDVSGQIFALRTARMEAAESLADALTKIEAASQIQQSLRSLQFFQDTLSVASVVNNAASSAVNLAQLDRIEAEATELKSSLSDTENAIANLQVRIDYFGTAQERISTELQSIEQQLNQLWMTHLGIGAEVLPKPQPVLTYP